MNPSPSPDAASLWTQLLARAHAEDASHHLIAFSGGIDSSLVALLVFRAFPERARAIIGVSAALPLEQLEKARFVANLIGVPLDEVPTREGDREGYVANAGEACYFCKTTLYETLDRLAEGLEATGTAPTDRHSVLLYNGTNADDLDDPTRLGLKAAREFRVRSPLAGLSKLEVRAVARFAGLPNWNDAASPCLRSRLQYGVPASPENLHRIGEAERGIRRRLELPEQVDLRVRHLSGDEACIELSAEWLPRLESTWNAHRRALEALGFQKVSFRPFRSGNLSIYANMESDTASATSPSSSPTWSV